MLGVTICENLNTFSEIFVKQVCHLKANNSIDSLDVYMYSVASDGSCFRICSFLYLKDSNKFRCKIIGRDK